MSTEAADTWPRRRNRRSRRSSLQDETATTISCEVQDGLADAPPSRQNTGSSRQSSFPRTDSGDSRRVYFESKVDDRKRERDRDSSPARSSLSDSDNVTVRGENARTWRWDRRDSYDRYSTPSRSRRGRGRNSPLGSAIARYVGNLASDIGPETVCEAFLWTQVLGIAVGFAVALVYSIADGRPANGFAIGTFIVVACTTLMSSLQREHLAASCRCTPDMREKFNNLENGVSHRQVTRQIDRLHDHIEELRVESARYLRANRNSQPASFMPARVASRGSRRRDNTGEQEQQSRERERERDRDSEGGLKSGRFQRQSSIIVMSDGDEDPAPSVVTPDTQTMAGSLVRTKFSKDEDGKEIDVEDHERVSGDPSTSKE